MRGSSSAGDITYPPRSQRPEHPERHHCRPVPAGRPEHPVHQDQPADHPDTSAKKQPALRCSSC